MNNTLMFLTTFLIQVIIAVELGLIGPLAPFLASYFSIKENMVILFNLGYSFIGFFVPYLGIFGDKYGKKRSLIISLLLFIFGTILAGYARSPYVFAFARIFIGFSYFSISATNFSYLSEFISYNNRGKASGLLRAAFGMAILFTPMYATYLVSKYGNLKILYIPLAIIGIISIIFLTRLPETSKSPNVTVDKTEFLSLIKDKNPKKILITVFLLLTAPTLTLNYFSIYLANNFALSQVDIGLAYTLIAIGTITGIIFSGIFSDKIGIYKLSKSLFTIMLVALIPIPFLKLLPLVIGFAIVFSFGLDGGWTSYQALCSEVVPEKRGTFMSLIYTVNAITITFYSTIGPLIYGLGGFKLVLTIASISAALALGIIFSLDME